MKSLLAIFLCLTITVLNIRAQSIAFPGAQGFGKYTTGGRGGKVLYVTSLADDVNTTGTFRWALNQTGSRIIMFKISGTITLTSNLTINNGDVTIAGQSAPGDGICLKAYPVFINADNVILRYMRFRMGDETMQEADALGARQHKNIIIDHCSVSWCIDEACSIYENISTTVQWTLISESLRLSGHHKGPHGYGGIWGGWNASFHHNLMAHHDSREPRFGTNPYVVGKDTIDYRNNVLYNWSGLGCYGAAGLKINMINNYYKPGPATQTGSNVRTRICNIGLDVTSSDPTDGNYAIYKVWGKYYVDGNYFDPSTSTTSTDKNAIANVNADNWTYGIYNQIDASLFTDATTQKAAMKLSSPIPAADIQYTSAQAAYDKVLKFVGCNKSRDSVDIRVINETKNGTATYKGLSPYNGLYSATYSAGTLVGKTTVKSDTTIYWKSVGYPKSGLIDSQNDIKPAWATTSWSAWPTLKSGTAPTDTDGDGMPDSWETANGLNPNVNDGTSTSLNGLYTNVEVYLNNLVDSITVGQYDAVKLATLPSSSGVTIPINGVYVPGESLTTTAVPNVGYEFVRWEDASGNTVSTSNPYNFAITASTTLKAVYQSASNYIVNFVVAPLGTGSIKYATNGTFIGGTRIAAKAVNNSGYEFVKWTDKLGSIISTSDSITYIVTKNDTVHAVFKRHYGIWATTTANLASNLTNALSGDTLLLAAGVYTSAISLQNEKILTLKSAGTGSVILNCTIGGSSVTDNNSGFIFDGLVIDRGYDGTSNLYFVDGSTFGNISILAFRNDTIKNIGRCLIRGGNTTITNLAAIEITNCFITQNGASGYCFLYPKFYVQNVTVRNNTISKNYGSESFFRPQSALSTNVLNFVFENNTVFGWSKGSSYAICNSGSSYSTASNYTVRNNIITKYTQGATAAPYVLIATGGNLVAQNNLIVNFSGYKHTSASSSAISDLSLSGLGLTSLSFPDTLSNDFAILASSPMAIASTTGGIIGAPRWLKTLSTTAVLSTSASPIEAGVVSPLGNTVYSIGSSTILVATPAAGYKFDSWSGSLASTANPLAITIDANKTIVANFSPIQYVLTTSVSGSGEVSPSGSLSYNMGSVAEITAIPASDWKFDGWSGSVTGTTNPVSLSMDDDKSVVANFSIVQYLLTTSTTGNGTISPLGTMAYNSGSATLIVATPANGWQFDGWSGSVTGTTNPLNITLNANKNIVANFSLIQYRLTASVSGNGSIFPSGTTMYNSGSVTILTATPAHGWQFDGWSGSVSGADNPLIVSMDANKSIEAQFTPIQYTLTTNQIGNGSVTPSGRIIYNSGSSTTITAIPDNGWLFQNWSGAISNTDNPLTVIMDSNKTLIANFYPIQYKLTTSIFGRGSVTPSGTSLYNSGSNTLVSATPSSGWKFDSWDGSVNGNTNPISIVMDGDKSIVAKFVEISKTEVNTIEESKILSIYPNPFTENTNIEINLKEPSMVVLKVFTIEMKEVKQLINSKYSKGKYRFNFEKNELSSGFYFVIVSINGATITSKILIQ